MLVESIAIAAENGRDIKNDGVIDALLNACAYRMLVVVLSSCPM